MTWVIASQSLPAYVGAMTAVLIRVLTIVALALMPVGMAVPAEAHAMPAMTADGHCGEHSQPAAPTAPDIAQCTLMCAALPAAEPLTVSPPEVPKAPRRLTLANPIHGIILEIATPPPRDA